MLPTSHLSPHCIQLWSSAMLSICQERWHPPSDLFLSRYRAANHRKGWPELTSWVTPRNSTCPFSRPFHATLLFCPDNSIPIFCYWAIDSKTSGSYTSNILLFLITLYCGWNFAGMLAWLAFLFSPCNINVSLFSLDLLEFFFPMSFLGKVDKPQCAVSRKP